MTIDDNWVDPTPEDPPPRKKRGSLSGLLRIEAKRVIPALGGLVLVLVASWQMRLQSQMGDVQDTAEGAQAKGEKGERVAKVAKVETQAGYAVTAEKVDEMGKVLAAAVAELKAVREDIERLKSRSGRPRTRRPAIKVPPVVNTDLPATPAAAAAVTKE